MAGFFGLVSQPVAHMTNRAVIAVPSASKTRHRFRRLVVRGLFHLRAQTQVGLYPVLVNAVVRVALQLRSGRKTWDIDENGSKANE